MSFYRTFKSTSIFLFLDIFSDNSSSPSASSLSKSSDGQSTKKYNNIFKTALNKGINFLSKIASSSSPSSSNTSTGSKCQSDGQRSSKSVSTESTTPSDCSSPDSLMTEMIFFKPICREPKTPSSNKPNLIRVPSIRSDASSTTDPVQISSPCPSPFFIPITPKRRLNSAFSFVGIEEHDEQEQENDEEVPHKPIKTRVARPRASVKRRLIELSPKKPEKLPKKVKIELTMPKTECRKTRSMYKSSSLMDIAEVAKVNEKVDEPKNSGTFLKPASTRRVMKSRKSMEVPVVTSTRVLRSRSFKH